VGHQGSIGVKLKMFLRGSTPQGIKWNLGLGVWVG